MVFILFIKFFLHLPHVRQQIDAADVRCVNGALCPQGDLCLDSWTGFVHVLNQASPHALACELCIESWVGFAHFLSQAGPHALACELCIDSWAGFAHVLSRAGPHALACELCTLTLEWCFSVFSVSLQLPLSRISHFQNLLDPTYICESLSVVSNSSQSHEL